MNRRTFIRSAAWAATATLSGVARAAAANEELIMTVTGPIQIQAAKLGVWVSLDGYSLAPNNVSRFPNFVVAHREAGTLNRVLLSHDDGWAVDGDAPTGNKLALFANGNPSPYEGIFAQLLPDPRARGFTEADFDQLLVTNPREALTLRRRLIV